MRKYLGILKNSFSSALEYRSNLAGLVLGQLVGMGVIVVLWLSVYQTEEQVGGFSLAQTVHYYVLVPFIGMVTSVKLSELLGQEIKDGLLSTHLIKPYNLWANAFMRALSVKIYTLAVIGPLYVLLLVLLFYLFDQSILTFWGVVVGTTIALFGFLLHYFLDIGISWLAFWTDDIWAFKHFKSVILGILGGVSFPFEFLPSHLQVLFDLLPFKYLYYVPLSYMLGNRDSDLLLHDLVDMGLWMMIFFLIAQFLWRLGIKKYGAYGG